VSRSIPKSKLAWVTDQHIRTAAGPYSQAIKAAGQVWVAGQIPADASGKLIEGSISDKTTQCIENIKAILKAADSDISKVVRAGVSTADVLCDLC
jgi:2-iminobutanoate/2-iminopropanoate deaminase